MLASLDNNSTTNTHASHPTNHDRIGETISDDAHFAPAPASEMAEPARYKPDGTLDISPEALYPRSMSCRQAFDQAFYCQSLGGKFNDIYRYGSIKSCEEQWGAFWFCMKVKSYSEKPKQDAIVTYYREREEKKKAAVGSSEDIWEMRTVPVEKAFWKDPDTADQES